MIADIYIRSGETKNGMDYFLVDKLSVDDIIKKFKGIEKLAK